MTRKIFAVLALTTVPNMASAFECKDAEAFYYYSMFAGKLMKSISGTCAKDMTQPACAGFMSVFLTDGTDLDHVKNGDINAFLNDLKSQCPNNIPDDPGQF